MVGSIRILAFLMLVLSFSAFAEEGMKKDNFNYSKTPSPVFSEAVTISNLTKGKLIFLAGVGAEDENGPRGRIRHPGDFAAQCHYAYEKISRALAENGATLKDVVKTTVYLTDIKNRDDWAKCQLETFSKATVPANTMLAISHLAWPEMMVEIEVIAVAHE